MARHHGHKAVTQFTCVGKGLGQIPESGASTNGKLFCLAEAHYGHFVHCSDKERTCVECTK